MSTTAKIEGHQTDLPGTSGRSSDRPGVVPKGRGTYYLGGEVCSDNADDMRILGFALLSSTSKTKVAMTHQMAVEAGRYLLAYPNRARIAKASRNLLAEARRLRNNAEKCGAGLAQKLWIQDARENERIALACDRHLGRTSR